MAALFLGRRKDIKKAASGPITEQVSGEQHNCCSVIGNLQNLKKLQNIFYDGTFLNIANFKNYIEYRGFRYRDLDSGTKSGTESNPNPKPKPNPRLRFDS